LGLGQTLKFAKIAAETALRSAFNAEQSKQFLIEALASSGPGIAPKFAQFLSSKIAGDMPARPVFAKDALSVENIAAIIRRDAPKLAQLIDQLDESGLTASLGQVHRAQLTDGRVLAIKVQRPGALESIDGELKLLFKAVAWSPAAKHAFDFTTWENWLQENLRRELNYQAEADAQKFFYDYFLGRGNVVIPQPHIDLCTKNVLAQTWEESSPISDMVIKHPEGLSAICQSLAEFCFHSIFKLGVVQTDLQTANFGWRKNKQVGSNLAFEFQLVAYDFGASMKLSEVEQDGLREIVSMALNGAQSGYTETFMRMGFRRDLLMPIAAKFDKLCFDLLKPMVSPFGFNAAKWNLGEVIDRNLGEDKWVFRTAGPPWFLYLMRMLFGLFSTAAQTKQKLLLRSMLESLVAARSTPPIMQTTHIVPNDLPAGAANYLQVEVFEAGDTVVSIQMPLVAVEDLENLIATDTREKIESAGINLVDIKARAIASGLKPQQLFRAEAGARIYQVTLR
jgi:predicted unusual protein kinase regulating ubiquinone biosynthesis (AarF/ABC1/UbiB family)